MYKVIVVITMKLAINLLHIFPLHITQQTLETLVLRDLLDHKENKDLLDRKGNKVMLDKLDLLVNKDLLELRVSKELKESLELVVKALLELTAKMD